MTDYPAVADRNHCPPHPGDVIDDILPATGKTKTEIAALLGISHQQFHAILAGRKPVSADTAARLGKLFGNGPGLWLRLQASHDAWHAARDVDVSGIPTIKAA
jgi:addiction module HigA family antidote